MNVAIIIPPSDFRDETVSSAVSLLGKWGVNCLISSTTIGECVGYHGAIFRSSLLFNEVTTENFDGILVPDGPGVESYKLYDERRLLDVIKHFNDKKKPLACVGNAIKILARANVISNVKIANVKDKETARLVGLFRGVMTANDLEAQGNIITFSGGENADSAVDALLDRLEVR